MNKYDIILTTVPIYELAALPIGIFLLKSHLEQNNFKCKTYELNRYINKDYKTPTPKIVEQLLPVQDFYDYYHDKLNKIYMDWIDEIKQYDSEWIGLSAITLSTLMPTLQLAKMIKHHMPQVKIVVGGSLFLKNALSYTPEFHMFMEALKACGVEVCVFGDGEETIVELLKGNTEFPGINMLQTNFKYNNISESAPVDLDSVLSPDYSDLDLELPYSCYFVYTSRGCCNHCKFCVESSLKKYRYRSSQNIIQDMDNMPFQNKSFFCADNMMNSNPQQFKSLIKGLIGKNYSWSGMYVCNSWMEDEDFQLAHEAGLSDIMIGMESGCEKVRKSMGKPFTTKDLMKTVRLTAKNNISITLLSILGWVTETELDFQENLETLKRLFSYGNITDISCVPLVIHHQMSLYYNLDFVYDKNYHWVYGENNIESRLDKGRRVMELAREYNVNYTQCID